MMLAMSVALKAGWRGMAISSPWFRDTGVLEGRYKPMPLFAIHALDKTGALLLRLEQYPAHRAFVEAAGDFGVTVKVAGPLQSDDGEVMTGSLFIVEAPDRECVTRFQQADPFTRCGVWDDVRVTRFHKRTG